MIVIALVRAAPCLLSWYLDGLTGVKGYSVFGIGPRNLERVGVYLLQDFGDGQTQWGTEPLTTRYSGSFTMASEYLWPVRRLQVQAILNRLDKAGEIKAVSERLYERIHEGQEDLSPSDRPDPPHVN